MYQRDKADRCPVELYELKKWNYIEDEYFDDKLQVCLAAGIAAAESHANIVIWPSTFTLALDHIESEIPVPFCPVTSVTVKVDDAALDPSLYAFDGNVIRVDGSVQGQGMEVILTAGAEETEGDIKSAILLIASELFRNPTDSVKQLPTASQLLLRPYRRVNI